VYFGWLLIMSYRSVQLCRAICCHYCALLLRVMGAQCLFEFTFVFMTRLWKPETFIYEGVSESFRTGLLERELQMVQLSATKYSCIAIVSQSSEFCCHNPLCCFSTNVYFCKRIFHYRLSPEIFDYTFVCTNTFTVSET